ncbi:MAG: cyclic nucleotide-binding domain-containing protein [Ignavibacteria bacterium]|nr:cyclic nucleotide-binding domain-containing protein [Ignavibacteria bacterium]
MFSKKGSETDLLKTRVKECPLFSDLSGSEIKALLQIAHIRDYSEGEKIFTQGTVGLCFYIIVKGKVNIVSEDSSKPQLLRELGESDYFSEVHLFSETTHTVSAAAAELTKLIVFAKPDFEDLVKMDPRLGCKALLRFLEFFGEKVDELYRENKDILRKLKSFNSPGME